MAEYEKHLKELTRVNQEMKSAQKVSEYDVLCIKKVYHKIAKLIHPDINPKVASKPKIKELWQRVVVAYQSNRLKDIQELEVLVMSALADEDTIVNMVVPDIEKKISEVEEEIKTIVSTNPYLYKFLLEDEELVNQKITEYEEECSSYETYNSELERIIQDMIVEGEVTIWQMN